MWLTTSSVSTRIFSACAASTNCLKSSQRAVDRIDRRVVRNVVPVVAERRRIEGEQPEARDAEVVQIRELLGQPRKSPMPSALLS